MTVTLALWLHTTFARVLREGKQVLRATINTCWSGKSLQSPDTGCLKLGMTNAFASCR